MGEVRYHAACAVFEETIVVSGGFNEWFDESNTVESYDAMADQWSPMPNMVNANHKHSMVAVKNKLFVISSGPTECEVYDNVSKHFSIFKTHRTFQTTKAASIGSKILIFQDNPGSIVSYDVDTNEWSEEKCEEMEGLIYFSAAKVPWFTGKLIKK